jgi:hypothetical protein
MFGGARDAVARKAANKQYYGVFDTFASEKSRKLVCTFTDKYLSNYIA